MNLKQLMVSFAEQYNKAEDKESFLNNFLNHYFYQANTSFTVMQYDKERTKKDREGFWDYNLRNGLQKLGLLLGGKGSFIQPGVVKIETEHNKEFQFDRTNLSVICVRNLK